MAGSTIITSSPIASSLGTFSDTSLFNYFQALLTQIGAPLTYENYVALAAWSACEGPAASQGGYNPLNTTLVTPNVLPGTAGDLGGNPQQNGGNPVKNYSGWATGVTATATSITNHPNLTNALVQPNLTPQSIAAMVGATKWGTSPSCIMSKIGTYLSSPTTLIAALSQPVNTNATNQGGSGATADAGAAVASSLPSWTGSLGKLLADLTSSSWWQRVGVFAAGGALFVVGLAGFLATTETGKKVTSEAAGAASIAAIA